MNSEPVKMDIVNESPKNKSKVDTDTLEQIFGNSKDKKNEKMIDSERNHTNNVSGNKDDSKKDPLAVSLLDPDKDKFKPPLADPELDELDAEVAKSNFPDVNDGLLDADDRKTEPIGDESDGESKHEMDEFPTTGDGAEDGKWNWHGADETDYPHDPNGLSSRFGNDGRPVSPVLSVSGITAIDVNTYQQKKNLAQGMMDLALLSANANQLRYVLESSTTHPYYYSSITFISLSILFQIAVGVGLIMNSRYDVNDKKEICKADRINNFTVLGIFLITIVNVFITSFSVATPPGLPKANP